MYAWPVSYTHLDVYKRQDEYTNFHFKEEEKLQENAGYPAVSYTHLDVYKRQKHGWIYDRQYCKRDIKALAFGRYGQAF